MFEVIWTDHNRELVGERRARKELGKTDRAQEDDLLSSEISGCTSIPTRSSLSSGGKSPSGEEHSRFLGSIRLKKSFIFSKKKPSASPELDIPSPDRKIFIPSPSTPSTISATVSSASSDDKSPTTPAPPDGRHRLEHLWLPRKNAPARSPGDSRFSNSTEPTTPITTSPTGSSRAESSSSSKTEIVQALGPDSWIAKTTETTFEPRSDAHKGCARSEVTIIVDRPNLRTPTPPASPERHTAAPFIPQKRSAPTTQSGSPHPIIHDGRTDGASPITQPPFPAFKSPKTPPSPEQDRDVFISPPSRAVIFGAHDPEAWKPPAEWDINPYCEAPPLQVCGRAQVPVQDEDCMSMDMASMQREVKRMSSASPQVILARLREEWGSARDPAFYRELEMEQKRWMLSALHNLDKPRNSAFPARTSAVGRPQSQKKILALFESKATASYLAAVHHNSIITHLSPTPLSHNLFPNIRPIFSPLPSTPSPRPSLPLAPASFAAAYSLSLPSALPSQAIPPLLRAVSRALAPGGALHLTLVDPSPAPGSAGPRLRRWLDDSRLLLNVERRFRCVGPTRLLPAWLADARLGVTTAAAVVRRFAAVAGADAGDDDDDDDDEGRRVRLELRSTAGRMLWREVWGTYVNGDCWWWEDPDIVDECLRLGTYWEYSIIEAVKEA